MDILRAKVSEAGNGQAESNRPSTARKGGGCVGRRKFDVGERSLHKEAPNPSLVCGPVTLTT